MAGNTSKKFSFCSLQGPWNPFYGLLTRASWHKSEVRFYGTDTDQHDHFALEG